MSKTRLIRPFSRATPPGPRRTEEPPRRIPDDVLRQASRRLRIMSLVAAMLWFLAPALGHLADLGMRPGDPGWAEFRTTDAIAAASILLSLALFVHLRGGDRDPHRVMDLGLVYLVLTAFALGVLSHWLSAMRETITLAPTITWIGPVLLMSAAIVPAPPWKMLIAGFVAASMDPLGMVIARSAGLWDFGPLSNALLMHFPNYLMLGVAVVISHIVTRLGQQVARERELGSYRLGELLGRGGMGEVYQATHRMLARPAAIKLIRRDAADATDGETQLAARRFRREAEAAANLRSPHTVELYDFGVTEDRTLYFVMELLEGMTLEELVRRHGPVPPRRTIHILRQVCESLEEAHHRGLVHRDIKPANIHLGRVGLRHDFVKVLDFGLVKPITGPAAEDSLATAAGLTPGTPAYMAPEITRGDPIDGKADVYALGCVAYFLLTGRLVFEADSALQMIARHLGTKPVPPSERTGARLPPGLEELVLACLAKDPAERPGAAELGRALASLDPEPWTEAEAREWWRANGQVSRSEAPVPPPAEAAPAPR